LAFHFKYIADLWEEGVNIWEENCLVDGSIVFPISLSTYFWGTFHLHAFILLSCPTRDIFMHHASQYCFYLWDI